MAIVGIKNIGNTCYLNSVLQSLVVVPPFVEYLKRYVNAFQTLKQKTIPAPNSVCFGLHNCMEALQSSSCGPLAESVYQLHRAIAQKHSAFSNHREQHDAHELFAKLLALVQDEVQGEVKALHTNAETNGPVSSNGHAPGLQTNGHHWQTNGHTHALTGKHMSSHLNGSLQICQLSGGGSGSLSAQLKGPLGQGDMGLEHWAREELRNLSSDDAFPFHGEMVVVSECKRCSCRKPMKTSPYWDISLPLPLENGPQPSASDGCGIQGLFHVQDEFHKFFPPRGKSLDWCLWQWSKGEVVDNVECDTCTMLSCDPSDEKQVQALYELYEERFAQENPDGHVFSELSSEEDSIWDQLWHKLGKLIVEMTCSNDENKDEDGNADKKSSHVGTMLKCKFYRHQRLMRLPQALCIHFQRLCHDKATYQLQKINENLTFGDYLDLREYLAPDTKEDISGLKSGRYRLNAVIVHTGSATQGHYTTYRREAGIENSSTGRWFHVSDDLVQQVEEEEVLKAKAYMLFYNRIKNPAADLHC